MFAYIVMREGIITFLHQLDYINNDYDFSEGKKERNNFKINLNHICM